MHIVIAVLGVVGAVAFWWYRVKYMGQAANEAVDAAQRAVGLYRRKSFKHKVEASTIDAIQDPGIAAAVLLTAIALAKGPLTANEEATITTAMRDVMGVAKPEEEMVFAKWAASDVADLNSLVSRLSKVWTEKLGLPERRELYDLATRVASLEGEPDDLVLAALRKLKERLAFQS